MGVLAVVVLAGGWIGFRLLTREKPANPIDREVAAVEPAGVATLPPPSTPAVPSTPAPATPSGRPESMGSDTGMTASEPVSTATATGDEPAIDDIVKKEAPRYVAEKPRGETIVLTPVVVRVPGAREPERVAAEIDRIINANLAEARVPASPRASDAEFLRRAYLDLTGCIPPVSKVRSFLDDPAPNKRERLIDELLAAHEYGDHFAHYWHELLLKRDPENNGPIQTHDVFMKWMTRQLNQNTAWDQVVRHMLTAEGDQALAGETFFILANSENGQPAPDKIVGTAAALFLGNQLQCAECHVHPIVPGWKQQDFWGLAAFFGKTRASRMGNAKQPTDSLARISEVMGPAPKGKGPDGTLPDGSIPIPDPRNEGKTIGAAKAKLFGDGFSPVAANHANRAYAADWFVSPRNPFFARAAVNRFWCVLFGRGLVNPLDDIRPDSKVSHLELLELLAEEFIVSRHDVKHLIRCICRSEAYQRSSYTNAQNKNDDELYSHMKLKVIPPRALFACLGQVTDNRIRSPRDDRGGGKQGPAANGLGFFDTREYDESPLEYTNGVPQLLRLMNTQLPPACDDLARTLPRLGGQDKVIEHLFLLTLGRQPNPTEASRMAAFIGKHPDPVKGYSAALWVLLHTAEFFNNH
jgi:hypothetical protein